MLFKEEIAIRDHLRERKVSSGTTKLLVMLAAQGESERVRKIAFETGADILSAIAGQRIELDLPITEEEMMEDPDLAKEYYKQHTGKDIDG